MMKIDKEQIERMLLQEQIKVIIAVLEMATRVMASGKEINDLVQQLREVLGKLMDDTAKDQILQWVVH